MGLGAAIAGFISSTLGGLSATTVAIVGAAIEGAISVGVSLLSKSLGGKPKGGDRPGRQTNVRSATMAHQIVLGEVQKGGLLAYVNGTGEKNKYLHTIVVYAAHQVSALSNFKLGGQPVVPDPSDAGNVEAPANDDDTNYHDYAFIQSHLGAASQTANADLVTDTAGLTGEWTTAHRLRGRAYIYAKLRESPARYGGIPPITARVKGVMDIYDPRDSSTGWSDNPALQAAWITEHLLNVDRANIDTATLILAANICDEQVAVKAGGTINRYTSNGFFELEGQPEEWLKPVIDAMAGAWLEFDGTYYICAGKWTAPVLTITDADFVENGEIILRTAESNIERSNAIKGTYIGLDAHDTETEFPIVKDAAMIAEDGGVENVLDIGPDLEFINDHRQAQRVAKIMLRRHRMDETFSVDVHLRVGLDVKWGDVITVQSDVLGIDGTYRITNHVLHTDPSGPRAWVTLTLRQFEESIFDWDAATDEQDLETNELNVPTDYEEPQVKVHTEEEEEDERPALGVDNETGNVGDLVIDLEEDRIIRKKSPFRP